MRRLAYSKMCLVEQSACSRESRAAERKRGGASWAEPAAPPHLLAAASPLMLFASNASMATPLTAKLNYRVKAKLEVFYTGAAARLSRDGKQLACACADEVKVRIVVRRQRERSCGMLNSHGCRAGA